MIASALIVGAGSIGSRHARNLRALGVEKLSVVDPNTAHRNALEQAIEARGFESLAEALKEDPQAVFICTPSSMHIAQARSVVESGSHVFIEKPLSHSMEGVDELIVLAKKNEVHAMVGCNMRFHPGPATVKRLIDEGAIGAPIAARVQTASYLPHWRPEQDYTSSYSASPKEGGALLDCIHEIDLALWYFGPASIVGSYTLPASSIGLEVEGLAEILLRHKSGTLSSVHLSFIQRDYRRCCQVIGKKGTVYWDFEKGSVEVYGEDGKKADEVKQGEDWEVNDMFKEEIQCFLSTMDGEVEPVGTLEEAKSALKIALKVRFQSS